MMPNISNFHAPTKLFWKSWIQQTNKRGRIKSFKNQKTHARWHQVQSSKIFPGMFQITTTWGIAIIKEQVRFFRSFKSFVCVCLKAVLQPQLYRSPSVIVSDSWWYFCFANVFLTLNQFIIVVCCMRSSTYIARNFLCLFFDVSISIKPIDKL